MFRVFNGIDNHFRWQFHPRELSQYQLPLHHHFTSLQSSSWSNHSEVTLLVPCSLACSSVIILRTTTSAIHNANRIRNIAKLDPWWWNWYEFGNGPGGGHADTPNVTRLDIPLTDIVHLIIDSNFEIWNACVLATRQDRNGKRNKCRYRASAHRGVETPMCSGWRLQRIALMKYESL